MSVADIAVVFPYYNESETIRTTLELISRQTLMPREALFVDSSSTDDSARIIDHWIGEHQPGFETRFRNLHEGTNTPSSSKNVGIKRAAAAWLAFMDCGQIFEKDWLEQQWDYVREHPGVEVVSGGCIQEGACLIDRSAVAMTAGYKVFRPTIPTTLVKKSVFGRTGLFLEDRRAGYDMAWPLALKRLGIRRGINERVVIRYIGVNYARSVGGCFKKAYSYAAPAVAMPGFYTPYAYLAALIILLGSCAASARACWFFLAGYILFRGYYYPGRKSRGFALIQEYPLALLTLPLVAGAIDAGRLLGYMKGVWEYHVAKPRFS